MTVSRKPVSSTLAPMSKTTFADHGRAMLVHHGERILSEILRAIRHVGSFFRVMAITLPVFFVGLLVVLWHLGH